MFLIVKRRIFFLNQILEKFLKISSRKSGKIEAELTSSKKLSESELSVINTEISKTIGSKVNLSYQVDKSLISGIKLQVGSFLIDSSISNKLKKYKQIMVDK
jgi:ATP synthase, F1 delta subunit